MRKLSGPRLALCSAIYANALEQCISAIDRGVLQPFIAAIKNVKVGSADRDTAVATFADELLKILHTSMAADMSERGVSQKEMDEYFRKQNEYWASRPNLGKRLRKNLAGEPRLLTLIRAHLAKLIKASPDERKKLALARNLRQLTGRSRKS